MRKILFGVVGLVICILVVVFLMTGFSREPNVVKILEEKGYANIEIINKETKSVRDQDIGISSSRTIVTVKAISPNSEHVRIKFSYCYPISVEPTIEIE